MFPFRALSLLTQHSVARRSGGGSGSSDLVAVVLVDGQIYS